MTASGFEARRNGGAADRHRPAGSSGEPPRWRRGREPARPRRGGRRGHLGGPVPIPHPAGFRPDRDLLQPDVRLRRLLLRRLHRVLLPARRGIERRVSGEHRDQGVVAVRLLRGVRPVQQLAGPKVPVLHGLHPDERLLHLPVRPRLLCLPTHLLQYDRIQPMPPEHQRQGGLPSRYLRDSLEHFVHRVWERPIEEQRHLRGRRPLPRGPELLRAGVLR